MEIFKTGKDGGLKSTVNGFWFIEWKNLFSIVLLRFEKGSRENYHSHAFNAVSWFLKGVLEEHTIDLKNKKITKKWFKGICKPKYTPRSQVHKFFCKEEALCLTFRGKWVDRWIEYNQQKDEVITLTHGRKIIS